MVSVVTTFLVLDTDWDWTKQALGAWGYSPAAGRAGVTVCCSTINFVSCQTHKALELNMKRQRAEGLALCSLYGNEGRLLGRAG